MRKQVVIFTIKIGKTRKTIVATTTVEDYLNLELIIALCI